MFVFSEYAKSSQQILVCGLCEVDIRIKVKCIDCDLFLCQRCQDNAHPIFKNAYLHDVVPLKDVPFYEKKGAIQNDFRSVKCENHSTKLCCIYCVTCRQLVCEVCIAETHEMHNTEDIPSFCHNRIKKLKTMYSKTMHDVEGIISGLQQMHEIQTDNYDTMENLLLKEKEDAIKQINSKYVELLSHYNEKKGKCLELMGVKETALCEDEQFASEILEDVETLFETRDIPNFLDKTEYLETFLRNLSLQNGYDVHVLHFFPKQFQFRIWSETIQTEIIIKPKRFLICDMPFINTLTSDQGGTIWIADDKNNIKQLEIRETVTTLKSTQLDVNIEEIRYLPDNGIIFTSSTKIMQLATDAVNELTCFDPYEPSTIHVSHDNKIVVGFYRSRKFPETKDQPVIVKFDLNGKTTQVFRNEETRLLQRDVVRSCTTLPNQNIAYIDSYMYGAFPEEGHVVNIDNNGIVQWKYTGNPILNVERFNPLECITTRCNNLLISDKNEGALHILTPMGSLLTVVDVRHIGLPVPSLMTMDINGTLWINSNPGYQTTLCAVDYSGF